MPVNNEDAHLKTQNLREKFCDLEAPLPSLFSMSLKPWGPQGTCKLKINLGTVNFFKKTIKRFLNYREICRREPN